jgi:hypothetical protein
LTAHSTRAGQARLRRSLERGRMAEIKRALRNDQHFICHKTSDETGNGTNLMCAGALAWQRKRGLSSNLERVMSALDYFMTRRRARERAQEGT